MTRDGDLRDARDARDARVAWHRALGDPHRLAMVDALVPGDRTPGELGGVTGLAPNHVAFHLRVLEAADVVEVRRSEGDGRRRYVTLRHGARPAAGVATGLTPPRRPLFVCTRNSARSQLAAALWRATTGRDAVSAGTEPADVVHPRALRVAARHGLDLDARPRHVRTVRGRPDLVVAVCDRAHEQGPAGAADRADVRLHWSVPDPADGPEAAFTAAYDELAVRVHRLAVATGLEAAA